jgi:hypothetical protein
MPLTDGSGSGSGSSYFCHRPSITLFFKSFSAYYFFKVHLHHFSKIISNEKVTKQYQSRFFVYFLLDDRRIQIRILTNGSGSRRPKKHTDPLVPDPQHCYKLSELLANDLKKSEHAIVKTCDINIAALSGALSAWTSSSQIYRICRRPSGRSHFTLFDFPQH